MFIKGARLDDDFATRVSHVCRQWRSVALETPDVWSKVVFTPKSYKERPDFSKQVEWLKRSCGALLTIEFRELAVFTGRHARWHTQHSATNRMMEVIIPYAPCWQILEGTRCSWSGIYEKIMATLSDLETPKLESVRLLGESTDNRWSTIEPRFGSIVRPNLKHMCIAGITCTSTSFSRTPCLEYLSMGSHSGGMNNSVSSMAAYKILSVLREAVALKELEVVIYTMVWNPENDKDQRGENWSSFQSNLEAIHLLKRKEQSDGSQPPSLQVLCTSLSQLRIIKFSLIYMVGESQLEPLGRHCPELETISLDMCRLSGEEAINRVVVARSMAGYPSLQFLEVILCRGVEESSALEKSRAEGLVLTLVYKPFTWIEFDNRLEGN